MDWGVPHQLGKGTSVSEDAGPRRGWIMRSHIGWGVEQSILYKGVPNIHVLKPLRGSSKGKAQRGQYLLAVCLGRYNKYTHHIKFLLIS